MNLVSSDRRSLIRLASDLEKGSAERRAIFLSGLRKLADPSLVPAEKILRGLHPDWKITRGGVFGFSQLNVKTGLSFGENSDLMRGQLKEELQGVRGLSFKSSGAFIIISGPSARLGST